MTKGEFNKEFGQRLRDQRGKRPRWRIAVDSGLSPDTIARYERGEGSPNLADASAIAGALGVRLTDLIPADIPIVEPVA